jgi:ribonucleotide monophosphatase NagD (HAD superfamily)
MLMIGDQLATDILGAQRAGFHSALLQTGVAPPVSDSRWKEGIVPTYLLHSLNLEENPA